MNCHHIKSNLSLFDSYVLNFLSDMKSWLISNTALKHCLVGEFTLTLTSALIVTTFLCHISRNATHQVNFSFENSVDMSVEVLPSLLEVPSPLLCGILSRTPRKVVNL